MIWRKLVIIVVFLVVISGVFMFFSYDNRKMEVELGGKTFSVKIADTNITRERGLSGHSSLLDNQGMIFVFDKPDTYGFWMKNMFFPIDIIWISQDLKINHIQMSVSPETYPKIFYPEEKSLYVLEISAGQSQVLNLKIGDSIRFVKN
jgi:hypothetical protein